MASTQKTDVASDASYPLLSDIRKSYRVKWYRCPIETATLHRLLKRDDKQGFIQAGGHLCLWLLSSSLVYLCFLNSLWLWIIPALFFHGTIASFFKGTSVHELGHGTVFKTAWLNNLFLYAFSTLSWWDPFDYATSHTFHHRYTLHPKGDRENLLPLSPMVGRTFLLQLFTINLFTQAERTFSKGGFLPTIANTFRGALGKVGTANTATNEWLRALHHDQPKEHKKSVWWSRWLLLFHATVAVLSIITGEWIWILIINCGSFIANLLGYLLGMTQHCGLKENDNDFRKSVRSMHLNPVFEFIYWRMNWHTEHHMFAGVPCYNLKALHNEIRDDMPEPRSLLQAWREMIDTWRKQQTNPEYFYDTPVPTSSSDQQKQTEMHASIGELAPKGFNTGE